MHAANEVPELAAVISRYVTPGQRHLKLGPSPRLLRMDEAERAAFTNALARDAAEITPSELTVLLDARWREQTTAIWLIAIAGRDEFRPRLSELLTACKASPAGRTCCLALARFGTPADAQILVSYLDKYLLRPDLFLNQHWAVGALLHIDVQSGTDFSDRLLAPDGPWQQWLEGLLKESHLDPQVEAQGYRHSIDAMQSVISSASDLLRDLEDDVGTLP